MINQNCILCFSLKCLVDESSLSLIYLADNITYGLVFRVLYYLCRGLRFKPQVGSMVDSVFHRSSLQTFDTAWFNFTLNLTTGYVELSCETVISLTTRYHLTIWKFPQICKVNTAFLKNSFNFSTTLQSFCTI